MSVAVMVLAGGYALLAGLLLSLNLRAFWHWRVKALAVATSALAVVGLFHATQQLLGWPTGSALPERFRVHAALVVEPDRGGGGSGAVYLWLSQDGEDAGPPRPRAHALPYARALHRDVARLQGRLEDGGAIHGRLRAEPGWWSSPQIELFEAPPALMPTKDAAAG